MTRPEGGDRPGVRRSAGWEEWVTRGQEDNQKSNEGRTVSSSLVMWGFSHVLWAILSSWKAMWWGMMCSNGLEGSLWLLHWDREYLRQGTAVCPAVTPQMEGRHHSLTLQMCGLPWDSGFSSRFRIPTHAASAGMSALLWISWRRSGPMLWRWDCKVWSHPHGFRCWPCLRSKQTLLLGPHCLDHGSLYTKVYFVLKLLAFLSVFQTDPAEMETSSLLF